MGRVLMNHYVKRKTLSPTNQFRFKCPIFNVETKIASCFKIQELVWRGKRPDQRKGCQACLKSSKCPIVPILTRMRRTGEDDYYSDQPVTGRISKAVLDTIQPILVIDSHMKPLEGQELKLVLEANENACPVSERAAEPSKRKPRKAKKPSKDAALMKAAATGDLAEVVNRMSSK